MTALIEQSVTFTQVEIAEVPWRVWEEGGYQNGHALEYVRRAEQHEIAQVAWQIWESEGRQEGRALEYMIRAEQQLLAAAPAKTNGAHGSSAKIKTGHRRNHCREAALACV